MFPYQAEDGEVVYANNNDLLALTLPGDVEIGLWIGNRCSP